MIGRILKERYKVLERIGKGGFGEVYLGRDKETGRMVAVKHLTIIDDETIKNRDEIIKRFQREARISIESNHQNLVKGLDYGEYDGKPYLIMEYIEGITLSAYIQRKGYLSENVIVKITKAVLSALSYLYKVGVTAHRDIKPANIMITVDGRVKLMDLGIVKALTDTVMTKSGQFIGSPYYVSPEQAEGAKSCDRRSDLYSLGVVMYEMATGRVPYDADTTWGILKQHLDPSIRPKRPRLIRPDIPEWLEGIILRALEKPLSERYQTPEEMAGDLERRVIEKEPIIKVKEEENKVDIKPIIERKQDEEIIEKPSKRRSSFIWVISLMGILTFIIIIWGANTNWWKYKKEPSLLWRYETGSCVESDPTIYNGRLYVGSDDDYIYCLSADSGDLIWRYKTGASVSSSPTIYNGRLYVGSLGNYIYCLGEAR